MFVSKRKSPKSFEISNPVLTFDQLAYIYSVFKFLFVDAGVKNVLFKY